MSALDELVASGVVDRDQPLGAFTTYKFGGSAAFLATVEDVETVRRVCSAATQDGLPILTLGKGSNTVISDAGFGGVVIRFGAGMSEIHVGDDGVVVTGAGAALPLIARASVRSDRGGLEFLVGIPGSVGGAVAMNAGCHGSETKEWLVAATVIDAVSGETRECSPSDLDMSYRHSSIGFTDIVVGATWRTVSRPRAEGERILREITRWRKEHQPGGTFNAGSVFKNPPGDAAGRLIDHLGLKGHSVGAVSVSERHGNFFVADDGATALDLHQLVVEVRRLVLERTGIDLVPEIRFIGSFDGGE